MPRGKSHASVPGPRRLAPNPASNPVSAALPPQSRPSARRIGVNVACEACRKRKIRCSGNRPRCLSCVRQDVVCQYASANPSETNSAVLKRKFEEVKQKSSDYREFYEAIRTMPEKDSRAIFRSIQQGVGIETVLRHIEEGNLLLQLSLVPETRRRYDFPFATSMPSALLTDDNPYLRSLVFETTFYDQNNQRLNRLVEPMNRMNSWQYIYTQPYHCAEIVNLQLSSVDFTRWTTVTADNELMRKLLHSYFLHEYSTFPVFQKDIFIQALIDGDNELCSPLLVNALLAEASHCYTGIPLREQFWNPQTLGYWFLAETRRLWELESKNTDLPTMQAALIIDITYANHGMDKLGLSYLNRAMAIAEELQLFQGNSHIHDKTLRHARDFAAWCFFNWQTLLGYYYFRYPSISSPPVSVLPDPAIEPSWYGDLILKYPSNDGFTPSYFPYTFNAVSKLRNLVNTLGTHIFKEENVDRALSANLKADFRIKFETWLANLPIPLRPTNIVFPSQLKVHMEYYVAVSSLLRIPITNDGPSSPINVTEAVHPTESLQEAITTTMKWLETVARLYYIRHSFEFCDTFLPHCLSNLGLSVLERLKMPINDHEHLKHLQSTIILCVKGIYDQGRHVHGASAVYQLFRNRLLPRDLELVQRHISWNIKEDEEPLIVQHVQSQYPLAIVGQERNPEASTLESLTQQYNEMSVEPPEEASQENEPESVPAA